MDQLNDVVEKAAEMVLEEGAIDVLVADTPNKKRDAWAARSSFLEAIEAETTWLDECDVVVPVTKIAEYLTYVKSTEDRYCFKATQATETFTSTHAATTQSTKRPSRRTLKSS